MRLGARFGLAFAPPPARWALGSPHRPTRGLIMQKARRHPEGLRPLVGARFQVLFHSARRGTFHRSVALLVRYRSSRSIQPWRVDPPSSTPVSRARVYSMGSPAGGYRAFTFCGASFKRFTHHHRFVRFRSPLLTESRLLSFPPGTEMFHFPGFALHPYAFRVKCPCGRVAPFGNPRITAWLPAPRGLSQVPASFIASRCQDIHRAPLARSHQPGVAVTPTDTFITCPPEHRKQVVRPTSDRRTDRPGIPSP